MKLWSGWPNLRLRAGTFPLPLSKTLMGLIKTLPGLVKTLVLLLVASFFLSIHLIPFSTTQTTVNLEQVFEIFFKEAARISVLMIDTMKAIMTMNMMTIQQLMGRSELNNQKTTRLRQKNNSKLTALMAIDAGDGEAKRAVARLLQEIGVIWKLFLAALAALYLPLVTE